MLPSAAAFATALVALWSTLCIAVPCARADVPATPDAPTPPATIAPPRSVLPPDPLENLLDEDAREIDPMLTPLPPDDGTSEDGETIEDETSADLEGDDPHEPIVPIAPEIAAPPREKKVRFSGFPFVFYLPETSFGFGFGISASILTERPPEGSRMLWFPSNLTVGGAYTLNNQMRILITPELYLRRGLVVVDGQTEIRVYPDRFYGLGRGSDINYQQYTDVSVRTSTVVRRQIVPGVYLGVVIDAANTNIHTIATTDISEEPRPTTPSTDWLGTGAVEGERRSRVFGFGPAFVLDRRDFPLMTRSGYYVRLLASGFPGPAFSTNRFGRALVDVRGFVPFLQGQMVLAMQWMMTAATIGAPFNHLASVGGPVGLRSFPDGRFRDGMQTFAQAELRFPIVWRFRGAVHAGVGSVFGPYSRNAPERILWALGGGLRLVLIPDRRLAVRGDLVLGPEGLRVMAFVHEAF